MSKDSDNKNWRDFFNNDALWNKVKIGEGKTTEEEKLKTRTEFLREVGRFSYSETEYQNYKRNFNS